MKTWIDEFIYRGRDPDGDTPPAWSLRLGGKSENAFGQVTADISEPMTVEQAEAAGHTLASIGLLIDAEQLDVNAALVAQLTAVTAERDALQAEVEALRVQVVPRSPTEA